MEAKLNRQKKLDRLAAGQTQEIALAGATKEVVIGGSMLTKKEDLLKL